MKAEGGERGMLKKIYQELVTIRKELQAIRSRLEFFSKIEIDGKVIPKVVRKSICDNKTEFIK